MSGNKQEKNLMGKVNLGLSSEADKYIPNEQ